MVCDVACMVHSLANAHTLPVWPGPILGSGFTRLALDGDVRKCLIANVDTIDFSCISGVGVLAIIIFIEQYCFVTSTFISRTVLFCLLYFHLHCCLL